MRQGGVNVAPGTDVQIAISPTIIEILDGAKRFDPLDKNCYLPNEFKLIYLPEANFRYQMSNCLFEALVQRAIDKCQCNPLPLDSLNFNLSQPSCYGDLINCEKIIFCKYAKPIQQTTEAKILSILFNNLKI